VNVGGRDIKIEGRILRVARPDADRYQSVCDPETLLADLRKSSARIDLFTFMQLMPDTAPKYTYPMEWDNQAVLPIKSFDHWWKEQVRSVLRNRARQAEKKGVVLREVPFDDRLAHGIWEIYNECPVRQERPFKHYGKDFETVRREAATYLDSSFFIGAFLDEKLIGFVKLTCDPTGTQANLMNIIAMVKHRDKAPTNALIAHAVRVCAEHKVAYLVYQNFTYGKKEHDSLTKFKENNGFQRVNLPRYYVPLTPLGHAALGLGLHHRLVERIPESLATRIRDLRTSWYNRKLQSAAQTS
jgi:hypothetical protein